MPRRGNNQGRSAPPEGPEANLVAHGATSHPGAASDLELLRALIDRYAGSSPPSQVDVETGLERGVGRLISLEVRLREQASLPRGTPPSEGMFEDNDLIEEIRAIREAIAELQARTNAGDSFPLALGFVAPRGPVPAVPVMH